MVDPYAKPHLDYDEQLLKLEARGLHVQDRPRALNALRHIGYYRLSAYLHTFRQHAAEPASFPDHRLDAYVAGSTFETVLDLWRFDRRLRLLVLDGLEHVEISLRTSLAYRAGAVDAFIHHRPDLLAPEFSRRTGGSAGTSPSPHDEWLVRYLERVRRSGDEAFVKWFHHQYDGRLPIWVAIELLEFGQTSRLLQGLPLAQRRMIASDFGVDEPRMFSTWVASFNGLRNVAAHHSRLWNRSLTSVARRPKQGQIELLDHLSDLDEVARVKVYAPLAMTVWLLRDSAEGRSWVGAVKRTLATFPDLPQGSLQNAGFPAGWEDLEVWSDRSTT